MSTEPKKSASEIKREYSERIDKLARDTEQWARRMGCYRDFDSKEIMGYFIIESGKKKNLKPIWCENFEEEKDVFPDVVNRMLELGIPIVAESFNGHYIGFPGEQGRKVGTGLNNMFTRATTARKHIEAIVYSDMWYVCEEYIHDRLRDDLKSADVARLFEGIDQLLMNAGIPVQHSFAELFIKAYADKHNDAAD